MYRIISVHMLHILYLTHYTLQTGILCGINSVLLQVKNRVLELREKGLEESELCVLTPYTRQCQIIRHLLRKERLKNVGDFFS